MKYAPVFDRVEEEAVDSTTIKPSSRMILAWHYYIVVEVSHLSSLFPDTALPSAASFDLDLSLLLCCIHGH
jgi:hypothetical protein